jgi:D-alanyl-D-alanine carboxypeptidase
MRVMKAEPTLGKKKKQRREAYLIPVPGADSGEKAIRVDYVKEKKKQRTTGIRVVMVMIPLVMLGVLVFGLWMAVTEFRKLNPLPQNPTAESALPLPAPGQESAVLDENLRLLTVVNLGRPMPEDFISRPGEYNRIPCDNALVEPLAALVEAAKNDGCALTVQAGYVDRETQQKQYEQKVQELMETGLSKVKAEAAAEQLVLPGGKSELETGLAVVFTQEDMGESERFEDTVSYRWLSKHAVEYGFVLRYPKYKESVTKMTFNPAQFRYVGVENAKKMRTLDMCLEEYSTYVNSQMGS